MHIALSACSRSVLLALLLAASSGMPDSAGALESPRATPSPALDNAKASGATQTAVLAGGCFWGTQAVFEHVRGVRRVLAGYSGGSAATARYDSVSTGATGHAESVQVTFDPAVVSYGEILRVFFSVAHDPTELNRQGPDEGTQYRSEIFYADGTQQRIALAYIAQLGRSKTFGSPVVTRVDPLQGFYPAEDYHQDYLAHHPSDPYIVYNDQPKLANLKRLLPELYRDQPAVVALRR
jgi:peptide-methionine (S)-S-oxide reductase